MTQFEKIFKGLEILRAAGADWIEPGHDQIWVSGPSGAPAGSCSDSLAYALDEFGWFWDDEADSWSRFT